MTPRQVFLVRSHHLPVSVGQRLGVNSFTLLQICIRLLHSSQPVGSQGLKHETLGNGAVFGSVALRARSSEELLVEACYHEISAHAERYEPHNATPLANPQRTQNADGD